MDDWMPFPEWAAQGTVMIDSNRVNVDDLIAALNHQRPGVIIRCEGDPNECIKFIPAPFHSYDFVAGMASENP